MRRFVLAAVAVLLDALLTSLVAAPSAVKISSILIDSEGRVRIIQESQEVKPETEPDQVSTASAAVADNGLVAGWLINYENCCTSYPIPLKLVIYRPGRPLLRLGDGMMICNWRFESGGKAVGFFTNTVHGDFAPHYELHDIKTGRLISKWDGHLNEKSPGWAVKLRQ